MNTAERIYVASTTDGESVARLAEELARRIEDDIATLELAPGNTLGSLRNLSERYRAGRSVVREAVGLLERRGLGRMRPGPCGGFVLARPRPETIATALADYFRSTGVTPPQVRDAREAVDLMAPRTPTDPVLSLLVDCLDRLDSGLRDDGDASRPADATHVPTASGTRAAEIAQRLAIDIARTRQAGARLGSEWDLCERFGVSRLTLRQAIRLLQDSGLVECRRGRGNGLVIRDRRAAGCIRLMLAYLIGEKLDVMAAGKSLLQLNGYVPALAVSRGSIDQRRQLEGLLSRLATCESFERYDLLSLVQCISRMADSPIIDLFSRCLAGYEARFRPSLAERLPAAAQANYFQLLHRLLQRLPPGEACVPAWARQESAACMLEMSLQRPI